MHGKHLLGISIFAFSLSGCAIWDAGYTENKPVARWQVPETDRIPITYSITLKSDRSDAFASPEHKELMHKIEKSLLETGLFTTVSYESGRGADSYHLAFDFHQAGMKVEDSMAVGLLAGYSLCLIPTGEVLTFDGSAVLSLQGTPIYSTAKAEDVQCLIWLPLAPAGIFLNAWTAWHMVELGTVNALVNDIANFHRQKFLSNADIRMIDER